MSWSCLCLGIASAGCIILPTSPSGPLPALGECNLAPNYIDSPLADHPDPQLLRWREFPVSVYVDMSAVPDSLRATYAGAAKAGAESWFVATEGRLGGISWTDNAHGSQIRIRIGMVENGNPGSTAVKIQGRVLTEATTTIERPPSDAVDVQGGQQGFIATAVAQIIAHEMGHALGILLHSTDGADLMAARLYVGTPAPWITAADRHTLLHAYCE